MTSSTGSSKTNPATLSRVKGQKGKTLVTGGGGFIGSHLVEYLLQRGDDVVVLDNFSTGKRSNLAGMPVQLIEGDIRNFSCVLEAVQGVDTVFHQAALCSVARSVEDPISANAVNVSGTLNVFEACRRAGVRRVVYASSSSVYGESETLPKHEAMAPAPLSPYAVCKLTTEYYGEMYWRLFGLETVALRYFNVFGPRQDPASEYAAVIPKFIERIQGKTPIQIFGDGCQTRDFTYVSNVVQANMAAASSPRAPGQAFNVACGYRWSLLDLVDRIQQALDQTAEVEFKDRRAGDIQHSLASISKAQELLGYLPSVDFEEGIRRTVDWFAHHDSTLAQPDRGSEQRRVAGLAV